MADKILMPRLSDTMTEGVIAAWHKKVGDKVKKGDLLAEIETDKATMELESYKDGTLLHLGGDKGSKIQVDELLAIVGKEGEDISSLVASSSAAPKEETKTEQPAPKKEKEQTAETKEKPATSSQQPALDISKMPASSADREEVVLMPRLSDTMEEGVISSWHKNVGDTVKKGDVLADIETDLSLIHI